MIEMEIYAMGIDPQYGRPVVLLRTKESDTYLRIWIGDAETIPIAVKLENISLQRPLTHDLTRSIIEALKATVSHVVVSALSDGIFYAKVILTRHNGDVKEVDARPSDAIAIALCFHAGIYAEEAVLEEAGIRQAESDDPASSSDQSTGKKPPPMTDEERERLSAFGFIEDLDLGDFDQKDKE